MGQDREIREGGGAGLTGDRGAPAQRAGQDPPPSGDLAPAPDPRPALPAAFRSEIRAAVRYEKFMVLKAVLALAVAAGLLIAHVYLLA